MQSVGRTGSRIEPSADLSLPSNHNPREGQNERKVLISYGKGDRKRDGMSIVQGWASRDGKEVDWIKSTLFVRYSFRLLLFVAVTRDKRSQRSRPVSRKVCLSRGVPVGRVACTRLSR